MASILRKISVYVGCTSLIGFALGLNNVLFQNENIPLVGKGIKGSIFFPFHLPWIGLGGLNEYTKMAIKNITRAPEE